MKRTVRRRRKRLLNKHNNNILDFLPIRRATSPRSRKVRKTASLRRTCQRRTFRRSGKEKEGNETNGQENEEEAFKQHNNNVLDVLPIRRATSPRSRTGRKTASLRRAGEEDEDDDVKDGEEKDDGKIKTIKSHAYLCPFFS